jgi:hypothetical protein
MIEVLVSCALITTISSVVRCWIAWQDYARKWRGWRPKQKGPAGPGSTFLPAGPAARRAAAALGEMDSPRGSRPPQAIPRPESAPKPFRGRTCVRTP